MAPEQSVQLAEMRGRGDGEGVLHLTTARLVELVATAMRPVKAAASGLPVATSPRQGARSLNCSSARKRSWGSLKSSPAISWIRRIR